MDAAGGRIPGVVRRRRGAGGAVRLLDESSRRRRIPQSSRRAEVRRRGRTVLLFHRRFRRAQRRAAFHGLRPRSVVLPGQFVHRFFERHLVRHGRIQGGSRLRHGVGPAGSVGERTAPRSGFRSVVGRAGRPRLRGRGAFRRRHRRVEGHGVRFHGLDGFLERGFFVVCLGQRDESRRLLRASRRGHARLRRSPRCRRPVSRPLHDFVGRGRGSRREGLCPDFGCGAFARRLPRRHDRRQRRERHDMGVGVQCGSHRGRHQRWAGPRQFRPVRCVAPRHRGHGVVTDVSPQCDGHRRPGRIRAFRRERVAGRLVVRARSHRFRPLAEYGIHLCAFRPRRPRRHHERRRLRYGMDAARRVERGGSRHRHQRNRPLGFDRACRRPDGMVGVGDRRRGRARHRRQPADGGLYGSVGGMASELPPHLHPPRAEWRWRRIRAHGGRAGLHSRRRAGRGACDRHQRGVRHALAAGWRGGPCGACQRQSFFNGIRRAGHAPARRRQRCDDPVGRRRRGRRRLAHARGLAGRLRRARVDRRHHPHQHRLRLRRAQWGQHSDRGDRPGRRRRFQARRRAHCRFRRSTVRERPRFPRGGGCDSVGDQRDAFRDVRRRRRFARADPGRSPRRRCAAGGGFHGVDFDSGFRSS